MGASYERRFRRFQLSYPVHVKFATGNATQEVDAVSRNVSLGGLFLESTSPIPRGSHVDFTITLGGAIPRLIILGGTGEVVRVEQREDADGFGIAVACAQPIHQIESYLPTNGE
jgi:PilZ domain